MKLRISNPSAGCTKVFDLDDDSKLRTIYDRRISEEIEGDGLGEQFKGYIFKLVGGCDKQGFPMKNGVLTQARVQLLLKRGTVGFQSWRGRNGERKRKSIRGCIYGPEISVVNMVVVQNGEAEIPGLTDTTKPRLFGPKRASKIRRLFNLTAEDDVSKYVIKHKKKAGNKEKLIGPKIQRLNTKTTEKRKRHLIKVMKDRREKRAAMKASYEQLLAKRQTETKN